ncbi:spore germination protein [Paenibacillus silvisoli]|uniref:spore germination protein n=1 Tax=Paenibacillus silvisoli TaxID=3110539 RepID=UPI0028042459|nr:spore germination protein [Paenibacillus silvisoli]
MRNSRNKLRNAPRVSKYEGLEEPAGFENPISADLESNIDFLKQVFHNCSDVVFRTFSIEGKPGMLMIYLDGMVDARAFEQTVLQPLLYEGLPQGIEKLSSLKDACDLQYFSALQTKTADRYSALICDILKAQIAILVDREPLALLIDMKKSEKRAVEEPSLESTLRGPREGFNESLQVNLALVRKRIPSHRLKLEPMEIGKLTRTGVILAYMDGIVDAAVLTEVKNRLAKIEASVILESEYIEEFIEDSPYSPFPQIQNTERPDVIASSLLDGKVALLVDGAPCALIMPMTFWVGLQAADDYYERFVYVNAMRLIRFTFSLVSLLAPALYVTLTTFHQGMIPLVLMSSISAARETSPFPTAIETILMELVFEGLQEAGIRLPNRIGPLVSIVGALVIGQAAVQAGIISAPIVIVVSATGIASYAIPRYSFGIAFRLLRFVMLVLASTLGLFGMAVGIMGILIHLVSLKSFGVPYFSPVAPRIWKQMLDMIIRSPRWLRIRGSGS